MPLIIFDTNAISESFFLNSKEDIFCRSNLYQIQKLKARISVMNKTSKSLPVGLFYQFLINIRLLSSEHILLDYI